METKDHAIELIIKEKEIARDILLQMMKTGWVDPKDYPEATNTIEYVGAAYKAILKAVKEG